ncbi:MAG: translocation/assembly module TamB domain-containing protein [Saprospiraceae bacterium]|nr:translocation/assembly module TamB domain-containing protein [Saprospiraceae bacterium]
MNINDKENIEDKNNPRAESARVVRHLFTIVRSIFIVFMILFVFVYTIIQIPYFQTTIVGLIANKMSKDLKTEVKVGSLGIDFPDKLNLTELFIKDLDNDTLIYCRNLVLDLQFAPVDLLKGDFSFDEIFINDAFINLKRKDDKSGSNLDFLLNYFSSNKKKKTAKKSNPNINIHTVRLQQIRFASMNAAKGQDLYAAIDIGRIKIDKLDFDKLIFKINKVNFENPEFYIREYNGNRTQQPEQTNSTSDTPADPFQLIVESFDLQCGKFKLDNDGREPIYNPKDSILNYNHLNVYNIDIDINNFKTDGNEFIGRGNHISCINSTGFELKHLSSNHVKVSPTGVELFGMNLITPNSVLGDTLEFKYREYTDFQDFNNKVFMKGNLNECDVKLKDIITFAPDLIDVPFFKSNRNLNFGIDGEITGKVNNLKGRELNIQLTDQTDLEGSFNSRNLTEPNETYIDLRLKELNTTSSDIFKLLNFVKLPDQLNKVGKLKFEGNFLGFLNDFVADGKLHSDIGSAIVDMRMDIKNGSEKANYSGTLSMSDFELGKIIDNSQIGTISFNSTLKEGRGLNKATMSADLIAKVTKFEFKKYSYENINMQGKIDRQHFVGALDIQENNIDLDFNGSLNWGENASYNFKSHIRKLYLKPLNLSDKPISISATIDSLSLQDIQFKEFLGFANITDFNISLNNNENCNLKNIQVENIKNNNGNKFRFESDIADVNIDGQFKLVNFQYYFTNHLKKYHPEFALRLLKDTIQETISPSDFTLKAHIKNSKNLTSIFELPVDTLKNIDLTYSVISALDSFFISTTVPTLKINNLQLDDIKLSSTGVAEMNKIDLSVNHTTLNNKTEIAPVSVVAFAHRDTINFGINAMNMQSVIDNLNLNGRFYLANDDLYGVSFLPSNLIILEEKWIILEENEVLFGKNSFESKNFILTSNERYIVLEDKNKKGISASLENFGIQFVNELLDYKPINFNGNYRANIQVDDIFKLTDLYANATIDTLYVNDSIMGNVELSASMKNLNEALKVKLSLRKDDQELTGDGFINLPIDKEAYKSKNEYDFNIKMANYPMWMIKWWVNNGVSDLGGFVNAAFELKGKPMDPHISGKGYVKSGKFKVDYLGTTYTVPQATLEINDKMFDATGAVIYDELGNDAVLRGGLTHKKLRQLGLDLSISSEQFMALNTTKEQNSLYYGTCIGKATINFSGDFDKTDIYVNATTFKGTRLNIPVATYQDTTSNNFVHFSNKDTTDISNKMDINHPTVTQNDDGIQMDMDLNVTDEAEVWLIFDERVGDIIKGKGNGNLQLKIPRNGDLSLYGDYEIEEGDYLFTVSLIDNFSLAGINKKFQVKRGGKIQWSGDPFEAQINLDADYKGLRANVATFVDEYINDDRLRAEARKATDIELSMHLQGDLLKPEITFDINLPQLTGELKSYADNKLKLLRIDQNELNKQVFGLIVVGSFLPDNGQTQNNQLLTGVNTLSEVFTNQLSLYVSSFLNEIVNKLGFISGVDLDVNYNVYQGQDPSNPEVLKTGSEVQLQMNNRFFDDRLIVNIGGNIDVSNNATSQNSGSITAGDISIEYALTKDRRLKLVVYQRYQQTTIEGNKYKTGVGLSYRRQFDSVGQMLGIKQ